MKFMDPSVLCGLNKMKFMVQGADDQQFAMDPGDFVSSTNCAMLASIKWKANFFTWRLVSVLLSGWVH